MKQRLADYVADFLAARGVTDVFSVVGGGAMHLNDALGHNPRLHVTYNHHEQACAIAAEAYARLENKIGGLRDHRPRRHQRADRRRGRLAGLHPHVHRLRPGAL